VRQLPAPLRAREARQPNGVSIDVPAGETRFVGPFGDYDDVFRIAEVTRFEDLHELQLVPAGLTEEEAVDAVLADDRLAEEERRRGGGCHCSEGERGDAARSRRGRPMPNLARLMEAAFDRPLAVDDPSVMLVRSHVRHWASRVPLWWLGLAASNEIHVAQGATLVMSPSVHLINASTITLDDDARLRLEGGSVSVNCDTLNGPTLFALTPGLIDTVLALGPVHAENHVDPGDLPQDLNAHKYLRGFSQEYLFVARDKL
jgi:hypothetical protein